MNIKEFKGEPENKRDFSGKDGIKKRFYRSLDSHTIGEDSKAEGFYYCYGDFDECEGHLYYEPYDDEDGQEYNTEGVGAFKTQKELKNYIIEIEGDK